MYKSFTASEYRQHFGLGPEYRVDGMLVYGSWNRGRHLSLLEAALGDGAQTKSLPESLDRVTEFVVNDKRYWFNVSVGGALLCDYLHLACLFGSQANILLGSCGGLDARIGACNFIVPTFSFGNESTTRSYGREVFDHRHLPDEKLSVRLAKRIRPEFKVWRGPTVTNQAMMAETLDDIQTWSKDGYLGVEMEAATVFAVSRHFAVASAALLFVGDNLIRGESVLHQAFKDSRSRRELVRTEQYRVAVEELLGG